MEYFTHIGRGIDATTHNIYSDTVANNIDPSILSISETIRCYVDNFNWHKLLGDKMSCYIEYCRTCYGYTIEFSIYDYNVKIKIDKFLLDDFKCNFDEFIRKQVDKLVMRLLLFEN